MISFTKVAIVDDKQPNRVSLNERLSAAHEFEVVFMAVNGEDFMDKMKNNLDESKSKPEDNFKKELEKRLVNNKEELEKNKKLLDELKNYVTRPAKEELATPFYTDPFGNSI